jgi:ADP-ribosylglycohydrolase
LDLPPDRASAVISKYGIEPGYSDGWEGISPFVTTSVLWSLYSFLRTPEDYWETICTAIAVGGDVDTTAAMAGAISGAYLGLEAIPSNLAQCLTDGGTWGFAQLAELAERCYQLKTKQLSDTLD